VSRASVYAAVTWLADDVVVGDRGGVVAVLCLAPSFRGE
jgi:hypothetical protein